MGFTLQTAKVIDDTPQPVMDGNSTESGMKISTGGLELVSLLVAGKEAVGSNPALPANALVEGDFTSYGKGKIGEISGDGGATVNAPPSDSCLKTQTLKADGMVHWEGIGYDGTADAPTTPTTLFTFAADTTTLVISVGGNEAIKIDNTGKVTIVRDIALPSNLTVENLTVTGDLKCTGLSELSEHGEGLQIVTASGNSQGKVGW